MILGIESVTSGSALGVEDTFTKCLAVFFAIVTHIWAESFTLCVAILKSGRKEKETLISMAFYSTITPIGVFIGALLFSFLSGTVANYISMILESFAAGSFLYVAITEIMTEEFEGPPSSLQTQKLACVLVGYIFMSVLAIVF